MLECVINISEGRDIGIIHQLAEVCGDELLDIHVDADHHRSVFTLIGEQAPRRLTMRAIDLLRLDTHHGVHPRLGVVDVVPFIALDGSTAHDAVTARNDFARWACTELRVPCFLYGAERTLPDIRRTAWNELPPQCGPTTPHRTAGAICVGARDPLVAYNVWLDEHANETDAATIARRVRGDGIRTLALRVGQHWQISMNLIDPDRIGPDIATDRVRHCANDLNIGIDHCELVGLIAQSALDRISAHRWRELDLDSERTIESRLRHGYTVAG